MENLAARDLEAGLKTPKQLHDTVKIEATADSLGNDLRLQKVAGVSVQVRNLSVKFDASKERPLTAMTTAKSRLWPGKREVAIKTIIDDISADMPIGSLTGVIGNSGSGKTTLLDVMSRRIPGSNLDITGSVTYNGKTGLVRTGTAGGSTSVAYVMQQDVLLPTLTVRETLQYAAGLRMPSPATSTERLQAVEDAIMELGLKNCANTRIGNSTHRGCSGGEKRRTSIGVQLLANQSVLFLDEPTTGLDATTAFQLVRTLKGLAMKGRTIIMTIHQPRSEIWGLLDYVVLLTRGSPVYSGPTAKCLPYFRDMGYGLPRFVNPGEFVIDLAAVDTRSQELESISVARVDDLKRAWKTKASEHFGNTAEQSAPDSLSKSGQIDPTPMRCLSSLMRETRVLTQRTWKVTCRDRLGVLAGIVEAVSMGVMSGWIFLNLGTDLAGIRSREGALYSAAALQGYLIMLFETYRLTVDIEVFDRERSEGVLSAAGFVLSRRFARFLLEDLPVPFLYSVLFYFMAGFRSNPGQFFHFFAVNLLLQYVAVNLATVCVALSRDFLRASLFANLSFTLQALGCGFFVNTQNLAIWLRWTKWTAHVYYAFWALCTNEFAGQFYSCPNPGGPENPACKQYTGTYILESLNLPSNRTVKPVVVLLGFTVGFFVVAGLILHLNKTEIRISRPRPSDGNHSAGTTTHKNEARKLTIALDRCALDVEKRNIRLEKTIKTILSPITATFQPGVLNVIMGPSGSGKSSLLNLMVRRLRRTDYRPAGRMLFNGSVATESVIRSMCSYVPQDDDGILPSLTVRETLRFAARLRLPSCMTKAEKIQRADSILLKLGLKDCADTLIGGEFVKGISGGERRRVTIAIQILTDPRILLLDEPTSGLDAFTASSIMEVLRGLAEEGRTIVLTIHQSRSNLFKIFGSVLLLARGGDVVYSGLASRMLHHFESLGYPCPDDTNPADFALDLVTVDLQQTAREAVTAEKVNFLVSGWKACQPSISSNDVEISAPPALASLARQKSSFLLALPILIHRGILNLRRQPELLAGRVSQLLGLGIVVTAFFAPLHNDYYSVQSRMGYVQQLSSIFFVGMLNSIAMYPPERAIFYHEDDDNIYPLEAFLAYYSALEIPNQLLASLLFSLLTVLAVGLPQTGALFFLMAYNAFCVVSCGESFGIIFLTLFSHTGLAVSVMSVVLSISVHLGGVISLSLPGFLHAVNYVSPVKWQVGGMAAYSMRGVEFSCTDLQRLQDGRCPVESGEQVLELYNLDISVGRYALALGGVTLGYRLLAYLVLKVRRTRWRDLLAKYC